MKTSILKIKVEKYITQSIEINKELKQECLCTIINIYINKIIQEWKRKCKEKEQK